MTRRSALRRAALALCLVAAVLGFAAAAQPAAQLLVRLVTWMDGAGAVGVAAFVAVYGVATLLMVPASWTQMAAGFLFGPVGGFAAIALCSGGFGAASFALGRTCLRAPVQRLLDGRGWVTALDRVVTDGGVPMVALLRLPPVSPYNTLSYALGLTGISFRTYLVGSTLGALMPWILYAMVGASVSDLAALLAGEASGPSWARWVGLGVTALATVAVTARVRHTLRQLPAR
ncbi:MAG: VTT domain-containing protein [Myxococcota bacterium]